MLLKRHRGYLFILLLHMLMLSCSGLGNTRKSSRIDPKYCTPAVNYNYDSSLFPLPTGIVLKAQKSTTFSTHTLLVANAAGVYGDLLKLDSVCKLNNQDHSDSTRIKYIYLKNKVLTQVMLISTEIESIAAELDCEGERAENLADYLTQKLNSKNNLLTVLSITSGALFSIAGTLANEELSDKGQDIVAVSGGIISASFGLSILFLKTNVRYNHKRNLLSEIWNDPDSSGIFPPSIWYMLNEPFFSNSHENSMAHNIKSRWKQLKLDEDGSKVNSDELKLLFGEGGLYSIEMLRTRASMLNEVQASIRLMNQDLQAFILDIIGRY